ncbi:DUF6531 domain-containing protein [Streptomyces sp. NPDC001793]|uniref:DUF6531 domain-containing protein n=1 Tax=Streptomyces sp. NPDC001793 TaxID=3154657 RepID=UPI00332C055B
MTTPEPLFHRPLVELLGRHAGYAFVGDGVQTAVGNHTRAEVDLPAASELLTWGRTYNSRDDRTGVLGRGWSQWFGTRLDAPATGPVVLHDRDGRALPFHPLPEGGYRRPQDIDADLFQEESGAFVLRHFSGRTWRFHPSGRLAAVADDGESVAVEHDADERVHTVTHSAGARLEFAYHADGTLARVAADDGRTVSYAYEHGDDEGDARLCAVTGVDGAVTRYHGDGAGRLVRVTDPDGVVTVVNHYDAAGRIVHQDLAGAGGIGLAYDDASGETVVTDRPTGARTAFRHDAAARVVRVTDPLDGTTTLAYDAEGRFTEGSTPGGTTVRREYDDAGNVIANSWGGAATRWTYDRRHRVTGVTDPAGLVTSYTYDGDGHLPATATDPSGAVTRNTVRDGLITARQEPDGGRWRYDYDRRRGLIARTDPTGAVTRYTVDRAGRRTAETDPVGRRTGYAYDAAGRPTAVTGPDGGTTRYHYSAAGRLTEIVDPAGTRTARSYDDAGRLAADTDALGGRTAYDYDEAGNLASITDPAGARTTVESDLLGRITGVVDPLGTAVRYDYDADGNAVSRHGPYGTTTTDYDPRGNPLSVTDPTGATTHHAYDALDRPVAYTDATGATWHTHYDDRHRTVTVTDPHGAVTARELSAGGRTRVHTDPIGGRTEYHYDAAGRLVDRVDPEGGHTRFDYDGAGRRLAVTTPAGLVTRFTYEDGRLVAVTDPRGWITRYRYDAAGRRTEVITPGGAGTRFGHDAAGRLISRTDSRGGITRYHYDAVGDLTAITDAKGARHTFTHDAAGRRTSATDPLGRTTRRELDAAGNLVGLVEPSGRTQRLEYDAAGRLLRRSAQDGTEVRYAYDAAGRRTRMTDRTGTTRYAYDTTDRLLTVTDPDGGVLTAAYDAAGRRTRWQYPDGAEVHYRYDLCGRLTGLRDSQAGEAVYAVDPDGRLLTEQLPGRWARRYHYDGGLLSRFAEIRAGVPVTDTTLTRDADGRIVADATNGVHRAYGYDIAGQLVSVHTSGAATGETHLAYDLVGNRTDLVHDGAQTRYLYDVADQLVAVEHAGRRVEYTYDPSGRLLGENDGDRRLALGYDGLGLLREATRTRPWAREQTRLTFNGDGLLTTFALATGDDDAPSSTVDYRWSVGDRLPQILGQRVRTQVPEADDTAPVGRDLASARFTYGHGRTFATAAHGSATFARDAYGSTLRTEETRPWTQSESYAPFGGPPGSRPDRAPQLAPHLPAFGYRGELAHGGALYLRARIHDTTVGRFTTPDPVALVGASSQANNPYAYVGNDPLNQVDPNGTWAFTDLAGGALGAVVPAGLTDCTNCAGDPGNDITRHWKCFQGKGCLRVRGYFSEGALNAEPGSLKGLYYTRRPERAAHALTLHELNSRREGGWDSFWGKVFGYTTVSPRVDWEVGDRQSPRFRVDITTEEHRIFEVKRWDGPATTAEVATQLAGYVTLVASRYGMVFQPSDELKDWADGFDVTTGFWSWVRTPFTDSTVYVWGLDNPPGHIYFAQDDKARDKVRTKADEKHGVGGIPAAPPIEIPGVPDAPAPVEPPILVP